MNTSTTDNNIKCSFCKYTSFRNYNLKRHEICKHSKEILNNMKNVLSNKVEIPDEQIEIPSNKVEIPDEKIEIPDEKNGNYCSKCYKEYLTIKSLKNHEKKCIGIDILTCPKCRFTFSHSSTKSKHIKRNTCEPKSIIHDKQQTIETQTFENIEPINNHLVNIILEKDKKINELNDLLSDNKSKIIIEDNKVVPISTLTLNNIVITSRIDDNYINAILLCKAGNKKINDWYRLNTTKELINELKSDTGIPVSQIIDSKKGNSNDFQQGTWIHPDLAIQLAQWISPSFALQVSKWIRTLLNNGHVSIDKIIQEKDKRIKLLEDTYLKKHKRMDYDGSNVIYMLTTNYYKNKRIYIIGKAKSLKDRLSTYNKTMDHEVVYYKECDNENDMNIIEKVVLNKLNKYREIANRDRFILPLENDIILFTNVIDACVNFFI